jgi:hypothetical protein
MNREKLDAHLKQILPRIFPTPARFAIREENGETAIECFSAGDNEWDDPGVEYLRTRITMDRRTTDFLDKAEGDDLSQADRALLEIIARRTMPPSEDARVEYEEFLEEINSANRRS